MGRFDWTLAVKQAFISLRSRQKDFRRKMF